MGYNKSGLIVLLSSVFFSFIWFAWLIFFASPGDIAELKDQGSMASASGKSTIDISKITNPWLYSEDLVTHGSQVYQVYCASCHGKGGKGDGLAAAGLKPPPRDLVAGEWLQGGSSIELYKTLVQGVEGTSMVSFSYIPKKDRWALVHYIRSITDNKIEDDMEKLEEFAKTAK